MDPAGGREKVVLESRAGESDRHIALKVLAYLLFRGEVAGARLRIEQGVGQRHRPDLVATEEGTGWVRLWVDCGDIGVKRLGRIAAANPEARVIVVKATAGEAVAYARAALRFLPERRGAEVTFLGFEEDFLPAFLEAMRGTNQVRLVRAGETVEVELNGERLATEARLFGPAEVQ